MENETSFADFANEVNLTSNEKKNKNKGRPMENN